MLYDVVWYITPTITWPALVIDIPDLSHEGFKEYIKLENSIPLRLFGNAYQELYINNIFSVIDEISKIKPFDNKNNKLYLKMNEDNVNFISAYIAAYVFLFI